MKLPIIVADTSPLIALAVMDLLQHLPKLFEQILLPKEVEQECAIDLTKPMVFEILQSIDSGILTVATTTNKSDIQHLSNLLDKGEASAIALAKEINSHILIDEKLGRKVAQSEGLQCKGSMYCLVMLKRLGIVGSAKDKLTALLNRGYYLDENLIAAILDNCGE